MPALQVVPLENYGELLARSPHHAGFILTIVPQLPQLLLSVAVLMHMLADWQKV